MLFRSLRVSISNMHLKPNLRVQRTHRVRRHPASMIRQDRHQPMSAAPVIVEILRNLSGASIAVRGGTAPVGPWLGLDLDDLVPCEQPFTVTARLHGSDASERTAVWATVRPLESAAGSRRERMQFREGAWEAVLPPLPQGAYKVDVEAVGVPGVDRVACGDVIGVVDE